MKHIILILLALVVVSAGVMAAELFSFRAFPVVDHCQLEWTTGQEDNLRTFVIERSADATNFVVVGQLASRGSFSQYDFTDVSPLDVDLTRPFYYRLKMVDKDGAYRYSDIREVSLSFSAVQHTWGSIKAMFR
jgi:hypothetical protein